MSLTDVPKLCQQKTDYFQHQESVISDFKPDQCVIINENFLQQIRGFDYVKPTLEKPPPLEWYPFVNSYYSHTEDVDAFERVSKLLASKPSLTSVRSENDILYEVDPYSEKDAHLQYLSSKPVSFLILGKPGIGQERLAKKLADYWRCVYIEPETLIKEEIASGSRAGECIEFNLRCGRAIGIDVILRLVEKRVKSKSAQHRGFVISGIPVVPNELYEEDPVSSESAVFNVQEIFEEICDIVVDIGVPGTKHVSIMSSKADQSMAGEGEPRDFPAGEEVPPDFKDVDDTVPAEKVLLDVGSAHDNICKKPEISTNCEEQLEFIFGLLEEPLIIIYMRCPNDDVISKRNDYRFDIRNDRTIDLQEVKANTTVHSLFSKEIGAPGYEVPSDFFDEIHYEDISKLQYLVRLPRNFPANVVGQLKFFRYLALNTIEQYIMVRDPQYFLKVDGRASIDRMFNIIKARLEVLPLQKVVLPEKLNEVEISKQGEEFDDFLADLNDMTHEEVFRKFCRKQVPNSMFKWNWSDWGKKCPVSMKEGTYKDGNPNFAVHFMNKMFFLADEDAFWKFYRNPRPYLLPPYPKPSCRIFIFGPNSSGKTTMAKCLGYLLNGTVLNVEQLKDKYTEQRRKELQEKLKQAALIEAINELNIERENKRGYRERLLKSWMSLIEGALNKLLGKGATWRKESDIDLTVELITDIDVESGSKSSIDRTEPVILPLKDEASCQQYLDDPTMLHQFLPNEISFGSDVDEPASVLDDFVITKANVAADVSLQNIVEFTEDDLVDMFRTHIQEVEECYLEQGNNRGGWIIDGMITDYSILDRLFPDCIADDVFILKEEDHWLLNSYQPEGPVILRNFRQLFLDMGNVDAAWRSPGSESTASMRKGIVRDILYDIIRNKYNFLDGTEPGEVEEPVFEPVWSKSVELYADHLREYNESIDDLVKYFTEKQVTPIVVSIKEKTLEDLLKNVVKDIQDRYRTQAAPLTDEDRYEEVQDFGTQNLQEEGLFEGPAGPATEDAFPRNRRYGDTSFYCPVSVHDKWVLWRGKEEYAAKFNDRIYLFSSEKDMEAFISDPPKYLFGNRPPSKVPPVRICVVGAKGVGKTTVAKKLSANIGVAFVQFEELLRKETGLENEAVQNLYNREDVPEDILLKFLNKLWFEEPFRSVGFVLDDFPGGPSDLMYMLKEKAIPDLILHLQASPLEIKNRLLNKALTEWRRKADIQKSAIERSNQEIYNTWKENRSIKYEELMEERRQERYTKVRLKNKTSSEPAVEPDESGDATARSSKSGMRSEGDYSQVTYDSFAEQEDRVEVEALLDQEMPEPVFDEYEEDLDEVTAQLEETIEQGLNTGFDNVYQVKDLCEQELIPFTDIDANLSEDGTVYQAYITTEYLRTRNKSIFERCYDVSLEVAEQLLSTGYYYLSKFGKTCPVQYHKKFNPIQMYIPMKEKIHLYPIIHRQFIYFLAGEENLMEFKKDPLKYLNVPKFNFPLIPYRISVVGAPKCGKTTLARRIQNEYSFRLVSCGQAIRYVLRYLPSSKLAQHTDAWLRLGNSTTHKAQMECVEAASFESHAVTQGIIFDGFPNNEEEVEALRDCGLVPHLILYLQASEEEVYERLAGMTEIRNLPIYSRKFFDIRYNLWKQMFPIFRAWNDREYQNMGDISSLNFWQSWSQSQKLLLAVFSEIKHYFTHAHDDWPLRVANMLVTPLEYLERQSDFKAYCPCCLFYDKSLSCSTDIPDRTNLVHFTNHFYWICDRHIEEFLKFPEKFLPPFSMSRLPKDLPTVANLTEQPAPEDVYEGGICMVCYAKNKHKKLFTVGVFYFAICYNGRVYLFDTKECMDKFMAKPHDYASLVISYKDPKNMSTLKYNELPVLGFLEQYVAKDIIKAINDVVKARPVVPGLSIQVSAAIHIALFLKLNSPNLKHEDIYKKAEHYYNERRANLCEYLKKMKHVLNPYIYYEEPMPKFKEYLPERTNRDKMRNILFEILNKIDYSVLRTI